jgi:FkbM family methyltransferase
MTYFSFVNRILQPRIISRLKIKILKFSSIAKFLRIRYFSLNHLDEKLERHLSFDNGYFVELGANDGVNQSNTLYFEHFRGWRGVLIEPYPPNFKELVRNRSFLNHFQNAACVGPTYQDSKVKLAYSNLMTSTLGIASEIPNPLTHAEEGVGFWGGRVFQFEARALTLNAILVEAKSPDKIDLLSLDVEGVELEILKGIDHSQFRFRYICVESRRFQAINDYLVSQHYTFVESLSLQDHLFKDMTFS